MGNLLFERQQWKGALEFYNKAVELDRNQPFVWMNRGITRCKQNNTMGALEDLDRAIKASQENRQPSWAAYFNRASVRKKLGRLKEAKKDLDMVIYLSRTDQHAYLTRGEVHRDLEMRVEMRRDFRNAYRLADGLSLLPLNEDEEAVPDFY